VPGTTISSAAVNSDFSDLATAMTDSVAADGQTQITGQLESSVTASPAYSSSSDNTTGFGVVSTGTAGIFASNVKVVQATSTLVSVSTALSVTGTANFSGAIVFTNGLTVTGGETVDSLTATGNVTINGILNDTNTGYYVPAAGTTGQRPGSPGTAYSRFNTTLSIPEWWDGGSWRQPIFSAPVQGSFKNLLIKNNVGTPNTQTDVTADQVVVQVSNGASYLLSSVAFTINIAASGAANELDTGSVTTNTVYYVYVIYNPGTATAAGLYSLSSTAPTLPSGYTAYARIGAVVTNGSSHFLAVTQKNDRSQFIIGGTNTANSPILATGVAGTFNAVSPTIINVSISTLVPSTATSVFISAGNTYNGNTQANVLVAPNSSWGGANNGPQGSGGNTWPIYMSGAKTCAVADILMESTNIYWCSDGAGGILSCLGWKDNLSA
jgi:hypothetical protein